MYKKNIALIIIVSLLIGIIPTGAFTQNRTNASEACKVVKDNKIERIVQGEYKGEQLTLRLDKKTWKTTAEVVPIVTKARFSLFSMLGNKENVEPKKFNVEVVDLNDNKVHAQFINIKTKQSTDIYKGGKNAVLKVPIALPILEALGAYGLELLYAGLIVYQSGMAMVNLKDCIDELRRKQERLFYIAIVQPGNGVFVGDGISTRQAVDRLQRGLSIFAVNKMLAEQAATSAGGCAPIGPEISNKKDNIPGTQFEHYHVRLKPGSDDRLPGAHSFF